MTRFVPSAPSRRWSSSASRSSTTAATPTNRCLRATRTTWTSTSTASAGPTGRTSSRASIELSRTPVCQLFTGFRGTGKSTEIQRLAARLSDPKRRNLLTVLIDADGVLDLTVEIDLSDMLLRAAEHAP